MVYFVDMILLFVAGNVRLTAVRGKLKDWGVTKF